MATRLRPEDTPPSDINEEMREFASVLCRALLMIIQYLNRRYQLGIRLKETD